MENTKFERGMIYFALWFWKFHSPRGWVQGFLVLVQIKHHDNGDAVCSYCFMVSREAKETEEGSEVSVPSEMCHLTTYSLQLRPAHQKINLL